MSAPNEDQANLLADLSGFRGAIWLRGDRAAIAISMADTKLIALGPTEDDGSVVAMMTDEGRAFVRDRIPPAPADRSEGGR